MDRQKVVELAREARLAEPTHPFNPWGASDDALERFAALIEREVRGDAEPVAEHDLKDKRCGCCGYMTYHREHMGCIKAAYKPIAPTVVRQLVEALEQLMSIVTIHSTATSNNFAWAEMDFAKEALATARRWGYE